MAKKELDLGEVKESVSDRKVREAREADEESEARRNELKGLTLVEFVHEVSPQLDPPMHLAWWAARIEACLVGGVRAMCSVPIRHHKTVTTLHGVAYLLLHDPTIRIIMMAADHERATELAKMCRRICEAACVGPRRGENIQTDWKNESDGGVAVMSAKQSKIGKDIDVLIFDDPLTETTSSDPVIRESVDSALAHYTARAGRRDRRGSVLGLMSRWDLDDPIGRRLQRPGWEIMQYPAIVDMNTPDERAFAPEVMTLEEIKMRRIEWAQQDPSERGFWAQFMNNPVPPMLGGFGDPARYGELETYPGFRYGIGVDLAYTPGESSDFFACVVVKFYGSIAYVVECTRDRADFNQLENVIRNRWDKYGRCPIYSYISGPEIGAVRYFTDRGIPIQGIPARYNKATRAQKTMNFWNAGKIQWPGHDAWAAPAIFRFKRFSGSDKARDDDEVDALVSVIDGMMGSGVAPVPRACGKPRI